MSADMIVKMWKEPELRAMLSTGQLAAMPPHPSGEGLGELTKADLGGEDAQFGIVSNGHVCSITDECPNSVFVCC